MILKRSKKKVILKKIKFLLKKIKHKVNLNSKTAFFSQWFPREIYFCSRRPLFMGKIFAACPAPPSMVFSFRVTMRGTTAIGDHCLAIPGTFPRLRPFCFC